jgi:hypothetical protein
MRSARRPVAILVAGLCAAVPVHAQQTTSSSHAPHTSIAAVRTATPPTIDGRLSDESWSQANPVTRFTQRDPNEGQPATERTEIRVLYDDEAVYVGARMYDDDAKRIARRLSNRDDDPDADSITIYFDPRHDHLTGVSFVVSAAGVQRDSVISNDTNQDSSWDSVWESAVSVDDEGWSAELRIPFSQLRFTEAESQTWGFNASRFIRRKNETAWLELVPKNENGLASRMAHLTGLDGIPSRRHLEIVPYSATRGEFIAPDKPGNPFNNGSRMFASAGLDLKARVTSNMTLDATINPDFGQAEVDPAVVNLSAFETFFAEKRRFFIEGTEIFDSFGQGGANNFFGFNTSDPMVFYSRRIGRTPEGEATGDYVDSPPATTILGAVKLTGKTAGGWSVGLIEAVTGRERANVATGLSRTRVDVEPAANYFVGRLKRDFSRGGVGVLTTSAVHSLANSPLQDLLTRQAWVLGGDGYFFRRKSPTIRGEPHSAASPAGST